MPTLRDIPIPTAMPEADVQIPPNAASAAPPPPVEPVRRTSSILSTGAVLGPIAEPALAVPAKEKASAALSTGPLFGAQEEIEPKSKLGWVLGGVTILAVAAAVSWFFYFSAEARMLRAIDRGDLVEPEAKNAYDLFLGIERGGLDASFKQKLRERALPKLQAAGDALLTKRHDAVNYKESELKDLGRLCEWAVKIAPEDPKTVARDAYARGLALLVAGNAQEALPQFQRAVNYDANWTVAHNDLGRTYVKLGDHVHAEQAYQNAIGLDPNWVYPYVNLGGVYLLQKDWSRAEQTYFRATQLDAALATPWYFLGQVYDAQDRYADAINAYERTIQLAAARPSSAFQVDRVQARIEKLKEKLAAVLQPPSPPAWPSRYWVRVFNCDDRCAASLDGRVIAVAGFGQDSGWVEVSGQSPGPHQLALECFNETGAITYGFTVRSEQQTVFHQVCGQAGVIGCDNNQPMPRGLAKQFTYRMMF